MAGAAGARPSGNPFFACCLVVGVFFLFDFSASYQCAARLNLVSVPCWLLGLPPFRSG